MEIELTLQGDATFGAGLQGNSSVASLRHIPGSVLRGAFAAAWIRRNGQPGGAGVFQELFEGGIQFGPLFHGSPPLPLSVRVHKRGVDDAICHLAWWDTALGEGKDLLDCPDCGGPLEMSKGDLPDAAPVRSRTHVTLTDSDTAVDGSLFTRQVVSALEPLVFRGELRGPPDLISQLMVLETLRVGGRRTTGGAATVRQLPAGSLESARPQRHGEALVLRLASPGVFVDGFGRPRNKPDPEALGHLLHTTVSVGERPWTRWTTATGGWHIASGLPKPVDVAVAAGSTFLLHTEGTVSEDDLQGLVEHGVGLRRHEGFGALAPPPVPVTTACATAAEAHERKRHVHDTFGKFAALRSMSRQTLVLICAELQALAAQRREPTSRGSVPTPRLDWLIGTQGVPEPVRSAARFLVGVDDGALLDAYIDDLKEVAGL